MKVTIVGVGGLGGALAAGLKGMELTLVDRHPEKLARFPGARVVADPIEAARGADVVLLCVKPKDTRALAALVGPALARDAVLVSCAAGVEVRGLRDGPAARAMPNIGAAAGASTTAVFLGVGCDATRDGARLRDVFGAVGSVVVLDDEDDMHAATAMAASGPAFVLLAIEALTDAGIAVGLPRETALAFARGALLAASARLVDGAEPAELRAQVTSPNGTTAAGIAALENAHVRSAYIDACAAAIRRSRELSS